MTGDERKTKKELIEELDRLRALLDDVRAEAGCFVADELPLFIFEMDLEGSFQFANRYALKNFGYTEADIRAGLSLPDIIHPDSVHLVRQNFARLLAGKDLDHEEYQAVRKDGKALPIKVYSQLIKRGGKTVGIRGVVIDVSEIRQVEDALRKSESHYRTLFETTGTAMAVLSDDAIIRRCNSQFCLLSGCTREAVEGKMSWLDFVPPAERERMSGYHDCRVKKAGNPPRDYEFDFLTYDGKHRRIHLFVRNVPDTNNRVCSLIDVTERDEALRALRKSEERYQLMARGANDGLWDWYLDSDECFYSPRYREILGYSEEEFPNNVESWLRSVHPDDRERALAANKECIDGKVEQFQVEFRQIHKDGSIRWILGRGGSSRDENGNVYRISGSHTDITQRKFNERTTHALYAISTAVNTTRDLHDLYQTIHAIIGEVIEAENFFIAMLDEEMDMLRFVYFQDEKDDYFDIPNISDPTQSSLTIEVFRTAAPLFLSQADPDVEERMASIGVIGTPPAAWLGVPLRQGDRICGAMAVQDYHNPKQYSNEAITFLNAVSEQVAMAIERKTIEEALTRLNEELEDKVEQRTAEIEARQAELEEANRRLMTLDEIKSSMVSSVSHELRTPLTSIRGFAKLCAKDFSRHFLPLAEGDLLSAKGTRIQGNLGIIDTEGERLTRLINDFLDINRIESGKACWNDDTLNPAEVIRDAVASASGGFNGCKNVELVTVLPETDRRIQADPDKIKQLLINLLNNAYKFTKQGRVTVTMSERDGLLTVSVDDTGSGIPEDELGYIFEKFHKSRLGDTVRNEEQGTGLGLAICKEIVEHYGGVIRVESTLGQGSVFTFTLPTVPSDGNTCPEP
ncbi:PAS domain S-box protein [uncultured Pseudodesulfovibrio sp.]|uniref:PAS domain S-box protein n=1 Tax=uncultured Pseudodesulfovibrio sp. TaxID=2035858 RepID=UPI0029C87403|nr:PAS domain S-box protein [uncultured Pseudodesulfovibrio sp.]